MNSKIPQHIWKRENEAAEFIPYQTHVNEHTIKTHSGDYLQIIRLQGVAHESVAPEQVLLWKEQLNLMLRNIASPDICIWTHLIRREHKVFPQGEFECEFDRKLNDKYAAKVCQSQLMINELYLSVIYRGHSRGISSNISAWFASPRKLNQQALIAEQQQAINKLNDVVSTVIASMEAYQPQRLATYLSNGIFYSEPLTVLDYLVNGEWQPRALPKADIATSLMRVRPLFGGDTFALKDITQTRFGSCLGISEYPEQTEAGLLNALLSAPLELVLTQSFQFLSKPVATELLQRQQKRLHTTGDFAHSQIEAIDLGLDDITSNRMVYGEHHLVLTVLTDSQDPLEKHLSQLKSELADMAIMPVRESTAIAAAFWSQLPANSKYRPRPAPISSKNFAGFCSFHNYPSGQMTGNQWGDAVTLFKTVSGAPYYFNFHETQAKKKRRNQEHSECINKKGSPLKDEHHALGNTLIIGASGSGKTVLQGFLVSQSKKLTPTQIIFDKDRGLEIYVRACSGLYLPLQMGKPTGFNPFQLESTLSNQLFLTRLISKLCGDNLNHNQQQEVADAVKGVMSLDKPMRRLSRCLEFLDPVDSHGCYSKLQKWCQGGELAWVLDNEVDELSLEHQTLMAFDVTEFLEIPEIRTPIVMYLFHRIESLIDGRRLQIIMDEFWKLLADEYFEDLANNKQKTIRKQNGIMVYGTQSARDVLSSPIAHSLIEQCATLILMPNPKARREDYIDGLHLTEREFAMIKTELQPNSRQFIVKQGHLSSVNELDLNDFDEELAVISGTTDKVKLLEQLIEQVGTEPNDWLPLYYQQLVDKRGKQ
ncbi:VirB4 family type IV secretion/conjugal transfer ATPase [Parashewanella spongiae]|uniref:Type IV secretion system protein virB4 n=1 Tax=Parashewanella spongiae TaxID=342950 RepID=A0A3A6T7I1_9GAMM|nr:VirB4 family type IV secretion/conjugal transfer ATPase [Parashewanella spongiae]MCL1079451.1 VirB4 family type IV secretion/conjugal transfer ATPase [Parashewanella spongiae]RJY07563.1 VirB4 family type IV secretion/conjugal transfer ATPase [Parashewanella spongiae]